MIYVKTELGKTALQDKSLGLTPKQRSSFIMFDGKRSVDEVLKLTLLLGVTAEDLDRLVTLGLLTPSGAAATSHSTAKSNAIAPTPLADQVTAASSVLANSGSVVSNNAQTQYAKAYPIAVRLTSNLGLRGFRLNLAVESSRDLEALKDMAPKIKEAVGVEKFKELEDALYR